MDVCGARRRVEVPGICGGTPFVTVGEAAESGQGDDLGVTNGPGLLTEFQLFWFASIAEDQLLQTPRAGDILIRLFEHENATMLTKARVLEIPERRFGMVELRESNLKNGSSNWLAWAAATGSRTLPRSQRNYALSYFAKASPLNHLVHLCISALP
jgi:hypothetical protein